MEDIFNIINKPKANPNRNGFDLSQPFPYSSKLGQVKPIYYIHTVPGGHYKIKIDELTHTEPFITDPAVRCSKHLEVVFTPYSQLWHGSSQFFGSAQDPQSSYEQGHAFVPNFNLGNMLERIWTYGEQQLDLQGFPIRETSLSLLDMLGYGAHPLYNMDDAVRTAYITEMKSKYVNAWALLAYNKYWNTYLRDTQHTSHMLPSLFNADKVPCTSVATSHMDDYYSDAELFQLVTIKYRKTKRDLFTGSLTSRQFGAVESVTVNLSGSYSGGTVSLTGNGGYIGQIPVGTKTTVQDTEFFTPFTPAGGADNRQVSVHQDAAGKGVIYAVDGHQSGAEDYENPLRHQHDIGNKGITSVNGSIPGIDASLSGGSVSGSGSFDVYTLLTAQLMQKWREQIQRAGNRTEDRLNAIYGRKPQSDAMVSPYIIGSVSYNIVANQVTATGASDGVKIGDIAAKGMGYVQNNDFEFDASEFGIITVYSYILPENSYLQPIDKLNTLIEPFDYFVPQIENLGLSEIPADFYKLLLFDQASQKYIRFPEAFDFGRFAARYWEYKTKVPVVHLGFEHGTGNSKWYPSRIDVEAVNDYPQNPFYVSPNEYDTVFGTITDYHLDTDQFITFCNVSCDAVLPMSVLGLPRW